MKFKIVIISAIFALTGGLANGMSRDADNNRLTELQRELSQIRTGQLDPSEARARIQAIHDEANDIAGGDARLFNPLLSRRAQSLARTAQRALTAPMESNTARILNFETQSEENIVGEASSNFGDEEPMELDY